MRKHETVHIGAACVWLFCTQAGWAWCFLSVSEVIVKESCMKLNSWTYFSQGGGQGNCFYLNCIKQNVFFIPRLEVIFAKFDEVQKSGGMILSVCKGKNK